MNIATIHRICAATPPRHYPATLPELMREVATSDLPPAMLELGIFMGHWHERHHEVALELERELEHPFEVWGIDNASEPGFSEHFGPHLGNIIASGRKPRLLLMDSLEAWKLMTGLQFGLVFIDGGHQYEVAYNDIAHYSAMVPPGGAVVIHDAQQEGSVARALQSFTHLFADSYLDDRATEEDLPVTWYGVRA